MLLVLIQHLLFILPAGLQSCRPTCRRTGEQGRCLQPARSSGAGGPLLPLAECHGYKASWQLVSGLIKSR